MFLLLNTVLSHKVLFQYDKNCKPCNNHNNNNEICICERYVEPLPYHDILSVEIPVDTSS